MTKKTKFGSTVVLLLIYAAMGSAAPQTGTILGLVTDDTGVPVANALVTYNSVPSASRDATGRIVWNGPRLSSAVRTGSDGTFVITGLPAAIYYLCASGVTATQLRSCEWTQATTRVDLSSAQTARGLKFVIAEGTLVVFQVSDPNGRIRDLADLPIVNGRLPLTGGNFRIGVFAGTRYAHAHLVSTANGVREYSIAIPKTATVKLFLETTLGVLDTTGATIAVGQPSVSVAAGGQSQVAVNLQVQ